MMDRKRKRIKPIAYLLIISCVMSGCNNKKLEIPDLAEPVVSNESYRPVEFGNVGRVELVNGQVVPMEYCHFWDTDTALENIHVNIGEYVEEGTVLATADADYIKKVIESVTFEKTNCVAAYAINCDIYDVKLEELKHKLKGFKELSDKKGIKETNREIDVLEENHRYDGLLYNHQIKSYDAQLKKQRELLDDTSIYARKSGYVTYVKDVSKGNTVKNSENVVIVSDYNDAYVELGHTIDERLLEKYTSCYTIINGKKYALNEYEYSSNEKLVADSRNIYPPVRLRFEDPNMKLDVGKSVAVLLKKDFAEDVLFIGNDSLYEDTKGNFVYVKNGETREVRYIETGIRDEQNTQVLSGLEEGELVYYSSESIVPETYTTHVAEVSDFTDQVTTQKLLRVDSSKRMIFSDWEGEVAEIFATNESEVQEGALICTIKTDSGSAVLADLRNSMERVSNEYKKQIEELDNQKKTLEKMKASLKDAPGDVEKKKEDLPFSEKTDDEKVEDSKIQKTLRTQTDNAEGEQQEDTTQAETTESTKENVTETEITESTQENTTQVETTESTKESVTEAETTVDEPEKKEEETTAKDAQESDEKEQLPADREQEEEPVRPYMKDELKCQIQCIKLMKKLAENQFNYQYGLLKAQYAELSANNNGSGLISVYSDYTGKVKDMNYDIGSKIAIGDKVCIVEEPCEPYIEAVSDKRIKIEQEDFVVEEPTSFTLNQQVDLVDESTDVTYTGKVVGLGGDTVAEKYYINTIEDKVYITNNVVNGIGQRAYIKVDDEKYFSNYPETIDASRYVQYSSKNIEDVIVLPEGILCYEKVKAKEITLCYVWKIVDGQLVKHYVRYLSSGVATDGSRVDCVIDGINVGDELAKVTKQE